MSLERGFKAAANKLSLEVRAELGLAPYSPLCPWALADNLAIPVMTLRQVAAVPNAEPSISEHVEFLTRHNRSAFSAITVFCGRRRCIIHNDGHATQRQRSNLAHELAHALLGHPPHPPFCSAGNRVYKAALEEEASWLGPVLLVSNEAARWASRMPLMQAAAYYGVSADLMMFRLRMSGAQQINRRTGFGPSL